MHHYDLRKGADEERFEWTLQQARQSGLLRLPGLVSLYFLKGIKGTRRGRYAAIWAYESEEAWEALWGTPGHPLSPEQYPQNWKHWEAELLAPFLERDPDQIDFTSYKVIG